MRTKDVERYGDMPEDLVKYKKLYEEVHGRPLVRILSAGRSYAPEMKELRRILRLRAGAAV